MEITEKDAATIIHWASIADDESMCYDNPNVLGRIKKAFPRLAETWADKAFLKDKAIAKSIAFYKDNPELP